ncbi:MAG TPA: SGNH/GDSL hydrolase family protein [Blastocatellia bacterium]|nr:SGNH/GDSL hydrolase family protein [Blastocatellia bacterium]
MTFQSRVFIAAILIVLLCSQFLYATPSSRLSSGHQAEPSHSLRAARQIDDFAIKDGDRIVFYGDSITEQRLYTTYVEHYVLTHYPDRRVTFINTGWGGDKVTGNDCKPCAGVGGFARIKRDVIDHRPTVVTLLFGMNDGQYRDFDPAILKVYEDGLAAIIRELKSKTRARIYVMTPTVYDGTRHTSWSHTDRYNEVLDRYSDAAKQIAAREGLPVIDLHTVTTEALRQAKKDDPNYTLAKDGVHPEEDGQLLMAAEILRAWGAPKDGLELNEQARLGENQSASFTVSAPLQWPQPMPSENLRKVSPQIIRLGEVRLRLAGLPSGKYKVAVDGKDAGEYAADALAAGIAISSLSEKAAEQSRAVVNLIRKRADFFFMRWRQIELPLAAEYKTAANVVSSFDALIVEMQERARLLAALHKYQLVISRVQ